ncbi:MAG TPA: acetyl-CoA carboxylase biotin carboxyl carrier protein [Kiritimatiellia bacterium]|nr:acetyl-CoA carboxylase biotin carboxyl carrier protein [Kiritimatiellia bacterium]HRZ11934.1 acetyl-CoA carboxylase biotin carboxyl carrier protein [Kiritimatiellia bacterium]HSA17260.1 acetyl-CoA carboxylase biotin carboxyl carrier protein [Kiritimatiellia bacterium]
MDILTIKQIVALMKDNDLSEFEVEEKGLRISIKRSLGGEPRVAISALPVASPPVVVSAAATAPGVAPAPAPAAPAEVPEESKWTPVKSPIVGTFYRAASPDAEPFVTVGQQVEPDSIVCIIEAMKVMNEIKAETRGVVKKILVDNASAVQYGQTLILIDPA